MNILECSNKIFINSNDFEEIHQRHLSRDTALAIVHCFDVEISEATSQRGSVIFVLTHVVLTSSYLVSI